jgi:dipeptidyl aminopeptidase/acylaminoacyl peptidase
MDTRRTQEAVYKAYLDRHEFVSGGSLPPNWTHDGTGVWYAEGAPENTVILRTDLKTGETAPLFNVAAVRAALAAATGHEPPYHGLPFIRFTAVKAGRGEFDYDGTRWQIDLATSQIERVEQGGIAQHAMPRLWSRYDYLSWTGEVREQLSPDGAWFASVRENNLVLRSTHDGLEQPLTTCGTVECFWDIEAQRLKLLKDWRTTVGAISPWSHDSLTLLAYQRDLTGVFRLPRINWLKPFEAVDYVPFQKAGARLDRVRPVFIDIRSGRQTPVALESIEDRYIQLLAWHPNGKEALIIVYTRDFKLVDIVVAERESGVARTLLTESAASFVRIQHDAMYFGQHGFWMLPNGSGFLWMSSRDGWDHLYRYDWSGHLLGQLTCGAWPVHDVAYIGSDGWVYCMAATDVARPYDIHVCRVPLNGGKVEQLTSEKGIHAAAFAPHGQAFLDTHSAVDRPTRTDLVRADGAPVRVLSTMDISRLKGVGYTPPEQFTVKAADGLTELWGVLYKPFDFDPARNYPVIESIYSGPQSIWTQHSFSVHSDLKFLNLPWALAQLGYIVVCLDARGTPGRSKAFHDVVYGNWTAGVMDHASAIDQLCARHRWMDANRVGICGGSWGGYFSTCALIQAPDTYHAAVSYAPGYDLWNSILCEPYLDLPQRNRVAYDAADLMRYADKVKGKLMIVIGTSDQGCMSSAIKMTRALIDRGIDHEFVAIPQAGHGFVTSADRSYFLMKLTGWFDRHVKNRTAAR